jgi:membrane protease YdiL (CAAX protease family)
MQAANIQSRKRSLIDLLILAAAVMGTWSLRFTGLSYVGPLTMAVGLLVVFALLRWRRQPASAIGLVPIERPSTVVREAGRLLPWFGAAWLAGGFVGVALFGQPQAGSAVSQLPAAWWAFLLDVTLVTWLLIGFGEEVVFRGFLLDRLLALVGDTRNGRLAAVVLQAAWFGSLHSSQGGSGMVITGTIGLAFAWFYLSRPRRNLWPLILVHATVDTIVLSVSWLAR